MNTIFKNISEFFTPEEPLYTQPQRSWGIDQSQSFPSSSPSAEKNSPSNLLSRVETSNTLHRKLSREAVEQFFTKVQSWFESSDEDDELLAYSTEDVSYIPGFGLHMREIEEVPRREEGVWQERRWEGDEVSRDEGDDVRGLVRTKSFSEPPRGRKKSRSVEPKV
jgi:hypothetical protein